MKYRLFFFIVFGFLGNTFPVFVQAFPMVMTNPKQFISVTIEPDFSAHGTWTLPINTDKGNGFLFPEYKNFGTTGVLNYSIIKIADDQGELTTNFEPNHFKSVLTHYQSGVGIKNVYVDYTLITELKTPLALYEFWVADGAYFFSPKITINFPKSWKLLSVWPKMNGDGNPIVIDYPTSTSYARPVLVLFFPVSPSNLVKDVGRFTIAAKSTDSLSRIEQAVRKLTFLDELYNKTLGLPPPEHITIFSNDLTGTNVGYEAEALATRPGIIIVNDEFVKKRSTEELETTLVHEITHLIEFEQNLFSGSPYIAPWFREGLAVFVENYAQPYIFLDEISQARQNLVGSGRLFNVAQLTQKYTKDFDYFFDGSGYYNISSSYIHAGLVIRNFFEQAGVQGITKLFAQLKSANSAQTCVNCDSDKIINYMKGILGDDNDR